jgi:hypothetical protein
MILADTLKLLTTMSPQSLAQVLDVSGYKMCSFKTTEFVGITNGGEFAYKVLYFDNKGPGKESVDKVYVKYNTEKQEITANF